MRGSREPYKCMFCGLEKKTYDGMLEHFMNEHKVEWSFAKDPTDLEKECWRE